VLVCMRLYMSDDDFLERDLGGVGVYASLYER